MTQNKLIDNFVEPLIEAATAKVEINAGDGNLMIDGLARGEPLLASGALQYFEKQGLPSRSVNASNGQATLKLKGGRLGRPWLRFPWAACNGATEWQVHLNPAISSDLTAHSDGGNLKLDLTGMAITHLSADTGGGNIDIVLPDEAADLSIAAKTGAGNVNIELGQKITGTSSIDANSGAGNVVVCIPGGIAARIHATTGLGKVIIDPQFSKVEDHTYESPDFGHATKTVEITMHSGAGNVSITAK